MLRHIFHFFASIIRLFAFGLLFLGITLLCPYPLNAQQDNSGLNLEPPKVELTDSERQWLRDHPVVKLGVDPGFTPFEFIDSNGNYQGMAADYIDLLSSALGVKFKVAKGLNWQSAVKKAKERELDALPCVGITEERKRYFKYTQPYLTFPRVIFVRKNGPKPSTVDELGSLLIGVQDNSSHHGWLKDNTDFQPILYPTAEEALLALSVGDVEAYIGNLAATTYLINQMNVDNLEVAFQVPGGAQALAFAVRNDWPELVEILDKALAAIEPDTALAIRRKWIAIRQGASWGEPPATSGFTNPERSWLVAHPEITVRVMSSWPPLNFVDQQGNPNGIGADFIKLLGERTGLKIKVVPGLFPDNLEAVKRGDADALLDVTPKPERAEYLNFTQPYLNVPHVIVARIDGPYYSDEDDLAEKTIALEKGFGNVKFFRGKYPNVKVVEYPDTAACLEAVSRGDVDAYAGNRAVAGYIITQQLLTNLRVQGNLRKDGSIMTIGVRKDWPELAGILDKVLDGITEAERQEILRRWVGLEQKKADVETSGIQLTQEEKRFINTHDPLVFSEVNWKPLSIVDNPDHFDGMIADYLQAITQKTGLQFAFQPSETWAEVLDKYKNETIDVIPALGKGDPVEREILLSEPFVTFPLVIVARDEVNYFHDTSELHGHKVAVGRGYSSYNFLSKNHPEIELIQADDIKQGLILVSNGEAFAFVGHMAVTIESMQKLGLKNLKIAGETEYVFDHRIGVDPKYPEAVSIINKALMSISQEERQAIYQKWLKVEYEKGVDYTLIIRVGIGAFIFLVIVLYWNRRLAKEVNERKKTQTLLTESENQIRAMSSAIHDALIMIDAQARVMYWNDAAERLFGISAQDAMGQDMHSLFAPESYRDMAEAGLKIFAKTGEGPVVGKVQELTALRADGTEFPVEVGVSGFQVGEEWYAVGTVRDITERKLAEEALRDSEERSRLVLESAGEGIFGVDEDGCILFINSAACDMLGICDVEIIGNEVHDLIHHSHADGSPYPVKDCPIHRSFTEGKSFKITDEVLWCTDGTSFPVEYTSAPLLKGEKVTGAVVTFRDITERKAAEEELRKLSKAVEQSPVSVVITDTEGVIEYVNPAFTNITGFTFDEAVGNKPSVLKSGEHPPEFYTEMWKSISEGQTWSGELVNKRKNGEIYWENASISPILNRDGQIVRYLAVKQDITEQKRAEELVRESENRLDMALRASNTGMWDFYPIKGRDFHNDQWYRQLGYERDEFEEGKDHLMELMHPEDIETFHNTLEEYARDKTVEYRMEFRLRGKDGNYRWIQSLGRVQGWDDSGKPERITGVHLDITERKESEQALKSSEERVRTIVDSINTGIIIIDPEKRTIVDANPVAAKMIGAERDKIVGQLCHKFICHAEEKECPILDKGKTIDNTERELLTASGDIIPVLKTVVLVELGGKEFLLESFVDITERKQAEEEVRRHLEDLERFNKLVIGRELKMIQLKEEINELLSQANRPAKYKIVE